MARIFSINVEYLGVVETGMVSVHNTPFFTEYEINFTNQAISSLLPANRLISSGNNQLAFLSVRSEEYSEFMKQVLKAVREHLETITA